MIGLLISFLIYSMKCLLVVFFMIASCIYILWKVTNLRRDRMRNKFRENAKEGDQNSNSLPLIIGFFHPFCDAMGGGEKVLFQALKAIQQD